MLAELGTIRAPNGAPNFDAVRRKYLSQLAAYTSRSTILYATDFLSGRGNPADVTINLMDMQALMEVVHSLPGTELDLILHTPGGSPEALESLVRYLRTRFTHIRAFVPLAAMSAGTMWALACDEIIMGKHSQLGPIDPQFALAFGEQIRLAPAQAILDQFERAAKEVASDPSKALAWAILLRSYGPSLLEECRRAQALSENLVTQWLQAYMLRGQPDAARKARRIARTFADYRQHHSHARSIGRDVVRSLGVRVTDLEADQTLQDAVLSVHHAAIHTFSGTPATKIVENNLGRAFVQISSQLPIVQATPAS